MSGLNGVLLDFGDTLAYLDTEDNEKFRIEITLAVSRSGHARTLDGVTAALRDAYRNSTKGEVESLEEFWRLFVRDLRVPENSGLTGALMRLRRHHLGTIYRLYGNVVPVLSTLKMKYKLALVSNCAVGLSEVIEALGLTRFFDAVVLSYEVGARKPDKRMYVEAVLKLGLAAGECVFVADEISDLEGARELGIKTILVRQGPHTAREARDADFRPDFECDSISEIVQFL